MTIGERISNKRIELGYSQEDLAKKCGWNSRSSISKIESSGDKISLKKIDVVAKALNVTSAYLMGWEDESNALSKNITIEDVEKLRGKELIIPRSDAQKLGKNEYYASDLIGLTICDEEGNELGVLKEVISTGANDVYEMQREGEEETILIPAISDCIKNVDIENGLITIHVMDGLL